MKQSVILVLEDNKCFQEAIKIMLQDFPYKVAVVSNGREGLEYLYKHKKKIVFILLDITKPVIDGLKFLSIVKQDSVLKKIPIILQTALCNETIQESKDLGANVYLQKPYTKETLYAAIEKLNLKKGKGGTVLCKKPISKTILIIEGCAEQGAILEQVLQPFLYKTVAVTNAEDALKFLDKHSEEVVLILMSLRFCGMSGVKFIKKIKANSNLKRIPIVIQSGADKNDLQKGLALGAVDYVQKPYTKEKLYYAITRAFN